MVASSVHIQSHVDTLRLESDLSAMYIYSVGELMWTQHCVNGEQD